MNIAASIENRENLSIISIKNPPVNALSHSVRFGIMEKINQAESNEKIQAIIITGDEKTFSAGADIKEFNKPRLKPSLPIVCNAIENLSKPVIAAIKGFALGGGFEIILSAHYRTAHKSAKFGLPEVNIGLMPGAGGTQRLPRLCGAEASLDIICSGKQITSKEAKTLNIIDQVFDENLIEKTIEYSNYIIKENESPCMISYMTALLVI